MRWQANILLRACISSTAGVVFERTNKWQEIPKATLRNKKNGVFQECLLCMASLSNRDSLLRNLTTFLSSLVCFHALVVYCACLFVCLFF